MTCAVCTKALSSDISVCAVTYKPTAIGTGSHKVTGDYSGTTIFADSFDHAGTTLTVTKRASLTTLRPPTTTLFPYTTLFRSVEVKDTAAGTASNPTGAVAFSS